MKPSGFLQGIFALAACATQGALAQGSTEGNYTDPDTGIIFATQSSDMTEGGITLGWALPKDAATLAATEYIGLVVGGINNGSGWTGISHGGQMPEALLLLSWADGTDVRTSFRYAPNYVMPDLYTGKATLTQISSSVNETNFQLIYRCQGCWSWTQDGETGGQDTTEGTLKIGWVQSLESPNEPSDPDSPIAQHDNGEGMYAVSVAGAAQPDYDSWVASTPSSS
ncbi:hypothetical protein FQN54_006716 [Arachnomyces sp. PD_36]|nr:hypothetical protein FQN54_006716 [Arachnomyces sp. PD_36]